MSEPAILVEGLQKSYGSVQALRGIDLAVPGGTILGLLGPNGAGKTTAVRILATLLNPDGGRASVAGHDVVREADEVRAIIGLTGQYAAVDENLTGRENLELVGRLLHVGRMTARVRADELLEEFDLSDAARRPVRTYSGGMRRRLDLAASLVGHPAVLYLDEPTTGLAPRSRVTLWEIIARLVAAGTTILLTTQYLEEADRLADRIAVVDNGLVVANDTAAALKARLGNTTIEIEMEDEETAVRAHALLEDLFDNHTERHAATVLVLSDKGPTALVELLRALEQHSLKPSNLAVREPTLDEAFLALTGNKPEGAPVSDVGGGA